MHLLEYNYNTQNVRFNDISEGKFQTSLSGGSIL